MVKSLGRIVDTGKWIPTKILRPNKAAVYLSVNLKGKTYRIHRLVAIHFIDNPQNKPQVNHKDCNKRNNHYSNLEWSTRNENMQHAFDNNLLRMPNRVGGKNGKSKIGECDVLQIIKEHKDKIPVSEIAIRHQISKCTVWDIVARRTWKHLKTTNNN